LRGGELGSESATYVTARIPKDGTRILLEYCRPVDVPDFASWNGSKGEAAGHAQRVSKV
jgi:hypothetical protein